VDRDEGEIILKPTPNLALDEGRGEK